MPRTGGTGVAPVGGPSTERGWDKALFERDELQHGWLTNSVPACLRYPQSEYHFNTHLAHPSTLREKALW
jgi:hypothetical protein